jgi:hypothetical protein
MTVDLGTALRTADPAAGVRPDPTSPQARRLLADVLAEPRPTHRHRTTVVGGVLAVAAAVAVFVGVGSNPAAHLGPSAYSVTRSGDGTVQVVVRWGRLRDPQALQRALDRAGARTRVFVVSDGARLCAPDNTIPYDSGAVDWHAPGSAQEDNGIVVHPDKFPAGATFVLVIALAPGGSSGLSTFAPGSPQITSTDSFMVSGRVESPTC